METIRINDFNNIPTLDSICATIGAFDGVHLGHQMLMKKCKNSNYKSAVITFFPDPDSILKQIDDYPLLMPIDKKEEIVKELGIDYFIIFEFNKEFSNLSKDEFINILKKLNVKELVFGYDFRFGNKGMGSIKDLEKVFKVEEIDKILIDNVRVSSTYIKELLSAGNISLANQLLGREYKITGNTFIGSQMGKTIGFPTANIDYKNYYLPKNGVYLVRVNLDGNNYFGMTNIGHNPTFN
ncbi:MAG: riboflavin biosynthesis protein RibF [Acholeplasmatales bacterium]|nr:riboflavin biosynthesis protein RibF [Acholeplasmatales bacterium]